MRTKTGSRFSRLCGWSARCAVCALALAFCASAFADPQQVAHPRIIKICYVKTIASGIPQRCDRVFGAFPTTANAMEVIGRESERLEAARWATESLAETVTQAQRGD
jgi:hypothetical protein